MYVILKKQLIKKIFASYFEFLLRGRADQTAAESFSALTCCWLHVVASSID